MFNKCSVIIFSCTLIACNTTMHTAPEPLSFETHSSNYSAFPTMYGYLEKIDEGYVFSKFRLQPTSGPWVKLNDMSPAFNVSPKENYCSTDSLTGSKGNNTGLCDTDGPLFRTMTVSLEEGVASAMGVIGTAFSLGLLSPIARGIYGTEFDESAYALAAREAVKKVDLENMFLALSTHNKRAGSAYTHLIEKLDKTTSVIRENVSIKTVDNSKIYTQSVGEEKVRVSIQNKPENPSSGISKAWVSTGEMDALFNAYITQLGNDIKFSLTCYSINNWQTKIDNCTKTWRLDQKIAKHQVVYSIESQNKRLLDFTPRYDNEDIVLYTSGGDQTLYIENKSDSFIDLMSLSIYINNDVSTYSNINMQLSPHTYRSVRSLHRFENFRKNMALYTVTKDDLMKKYRLGAAVKYRITGPNSEKTMLEYEEKSGLSLGERP